MRTAVASLVTILLAGCSTYNYLTASDHDRASPPFVPDAKTAIAISEALVTAHCGIRTTRGQRPFKATLSNDVWTVRGSLPTFFRRVGGKGGVAVVQLSKSDGKVMSITHTK